MHREVKDALVAKLAATLRRFYGDNAQTSTSFGRIISDRHFARVKGLLDSAGGSIAYGGSTDASTRFIAPTLIVDPKPNAPIMLEEIFGTSSHRHAAMWR